MVSSGQVNSDLGSIKTCLSNYDNLIGEMASSWKGMSYDNLNSKASQFSSEFSSSITSQMNSFASACDLYVKYQETKFALATARSNYNNAVAAKDNSSASSYSSQISQLQNELQSLKSQIENTLASVTGIKVEASAASVTTPVTTSSAASGTVALDANGNLANPYIVHNGNSHTEGLCTAMQVRLDKLATRYYEETGNKLVINSGSRTMEEQQRLYNQYGSSRAAKPSPNSPHIAGMAVDIDAGQANWMAEHGLLEECGLYRPLLNWGSSGGTNEPWHLEIKEWRTNGRDTEYARSLTS